MFEWVDTTLHMHSISLANMSLAMLENSTFTKGLNLFMCEHSIAGIKSHTYGSCLLRQIRQTAMQEVDTDEGSGCLIRI